MENPSEDVPLGRVKIGITYNLKRTDFTQHQAPDAQAEFDNMDTVLAIQSAIELHGLATVLLESDPDLPEKLNKEKPNFVFNIAEGSGGRAREAQVPALLSLLQIPFTGSDETALCLALDKALCKRLLATYHVPTPRYCVYSPGAPVRAAGLRYPVIVKPNAEGSSKGIPDVCIAKNAQELHTLVQQNISLYGSDVLVEEYIAGREFTVGLLGNGELVKVFPPMEILYHASPIEGYNIYNYTVKQEYEKYVSYACPAALLPELEQQMTGMAKKIFLALGCRDLARVDFRLNENGAIYFIEINPLPGLAPHYSDYPMLAEFCGVSHEDLVYQILCAGAKRAGVALERR